MKQFWEKPSAAVAKELSHCGCLWNTFVVVERVRAFVDLMRVVVFELYAFERHQSVSARLDPDGLYASLTPIDFSRSVLAGSAGHLIVLDAGCLG